MLPETMHAVRLFEYGGPQVLQYVEAPVPETGPDEVLIRVHATSVTNWDLRYRRGELTEPPGRQPLPLPFQLGREAAGEVALVGENVARFKVGDRVVQMTCPACGHCAYCKRGLDNLCIDIGLPGHQRFGGYADYVCRRQTDVLPAPDGIPFEKLACAMWSYSTVWGMAMDRGALRAGQSVLITGASSGMGTAAVQVARLAGAGPIIGTTGSPEKLQRLKEIGCDAALDYHDDDVPAVARELTGGTGVDLVLDMVGGEMFPMGLNCLRMDGCLVAAGQHGGRHVTVDLSQLYRNQLRIHGHRGATRRTQGLTVRLVGEGRLNPVIDRALPLQDAAEAHRLLESQQIFGKIVLVP